MPIQFSLNRDSKLLLAIAALFALGLHFGLWMSGTFCDLSETRCALIKEGMTRDELIGLMGQPGNYCRCPSDGHITYVTNACAYTTEELTWRNGSYVVTVCLDKNGRVQRYARTEGR